MTKLNLLFLVFIFLNAPAAHASSQGCRIVLNKDNDEITAHMNGETDKTGYLFFAPSRNRPPGSMLLGNLWVQPQYQRQGISEALLRSLIQNHPEINEFTGTIGDTNAKFYVTAFTEILENILTGKDGPLNQYLHPLFQYKANTLAEEAQFFSDRADFHNHAFRFFAEQAQEKVFTGAFKRTPLYRSLKKLGFSKINYPSSVFSRLSVSFVITR